MFVDPMPKCDDAVVMSLKLVVVRRKCERENVVFIEDRIR